MSRLATRGVADFHFLELLVLDLYRQIQHSFNGTASAGLKLRSRSIFPEDCAAQAHMPFFVRLYAFPIQLRGRTIAGSLAKFDELLVLFQRERLACELRGTDAFDGGLECRKKLEHRAVSVC